MAEARIDVIEAALANMQQVVENRFVGLETTVNGLQGDVSVHGVQLAATTGEAARKMSEMAQSFLDSLDTKTVQMKLEIEEMRKGCQMLYDEVTARHTQVGDWAGKVEQEIAGLATFAQEVATQHQRGKMGDQCRE